ncbi:hypothetical protein V5O48_018229 [Marasmius crinis-equi]|uniref:F-box domain-containing protein n=1 Tax=Marasmius crinis-equi TaxID=585013 RepID=A0ABR3ELS4_9AGAR
MQLSLSLLKDRHSDRAEFHSPSPLVTSTPKSSPIMASIHSIPNEILCTIMKHTMQGQQIRINGNTLEPMLWTKSFEFSINAWSDSPVLRCLHVCRRWREVVKDLPLWQLITIHQEQGYGIYIPCGAQVKREFLEFCIGLAESRKRALQVTMDVHCDQELGDGVFKLHCRAFTTLLRALPRWDSFHYISNGQYTSLRVMMAVLGRLEDRIKELKHFGMEMNWVIWEETADTMPRVVEKMQEMVNLVHLELDLGVAIDVPVAEVWDWAPFIPKNVSSNYFHQIRVLSLRCSPAAAWKLLTLCNEVADVHLCLSFEDLDPVRAGYDGTTLELKGVEKMVVIVERENLGYGRLFESLSCPELRHFGYNGPRWGDNPELVDSVGGFIARARGRLSGWALIPRGSDSQLKKFREKGLEAMRYRDDD